jgi:hypothetical protein
MPAFSIRQCDVAGTQSVSNSTLIATIRVRIRSDATAKGAGTSNYVTLQIQIIHIRYVVIASVRMVLTARGLCDTPS